MTVVRLDDFVDVVEVEHPVGSDPNRLRLDATEDGSAPGLATVGVGVLADDVLVASLAVSQQRAQVRLGPAGNEQPRFLVQSLGGLRLEPVDGGVVTEDVVADLGVGHGLAHGGCRSGHGVGAQIDHPSSLPAVCPTAIVRPRLSGTDDR